MRECNLTGIIPPLNHSPFLAFWCQEMKAIYIKGKRRGEEESGGWMPFCSMLIRRQDSSREQDLGCSEKREANPAQNMQRDFHTLLRNSLSVNFIWLQINQKYKKPSPYWVCCVYWDGLKSGPHCWWILFLLLLTTFAFACLKNSANLSHAAAGAHFLARPCTKTHCLICW